MKLNRKLRMGMVGGGRGAFIGAVHRMAARLDGEIDLIAGCFSGDPEKSRLSGEDLFLDPSRVYATYEEMARKEAALPADQRIDFVSIVTRNNTHAAVAKTFLDAGFHVICDKPLCFSFKEGLKLREVVRKSGKVFALTHNYTGYPMVKEARDWVRNGKLGRLMKVVSSAQISSTSRPVMKRARLCACVPMSPMQFETPDTDGSIRQLEIFPVVPVSSAVMAYPCGYSTTTFMSLPSFPLRTHSRASFTMG